MPIPVSSMVKQKSARVSLSGLTVEKKVTVPPCLLYLMLLSSKLMMIRRIWVGLPIMLWSTA